MVAAPFNGLHPAAFNLLRVTLPLTSRGAIDASSNVDDLLRVLMLLVANASKRCWLSVAVACRFVKGAFSNAAKGVGYGQYVGLASESTGGVNGIRVGDGMARALVNVFYALSSVCSSMSCLPACMYVCVCVRPCICVSARA